MSTDFDPLITAGTAVIADVFDSFDLTPPVLDTQLFSTQSNALAFAGPAYTISGEAHIWSGSGDRTKLAAIDAMPPGVVPVWAGNNIRGVCCFGDLLASAMQARGCAGVVVDGGIRDVAFMAQMDLPIVARYRTPAQAIGRWQVTASQVSVQVRGALADWLTVNPGDIVVADADGVIIIPQARLSAIRERATEWATSDSGARTDIQAGMPLLVALDKYGHL